MPDQIRLTLEGGDEILRNLALVADRAYELVDEAVRAGAEVIRDEAAARVRKRTGALARSMTIDKAPHQRKGRVAYLIGPGKAGFYGLFLELGTVKMPAHPFLVPALRAAAERAMQTIGMVLRRGLGL